MKIEKINLQLAGKNEINKQKAKENKAPAAYGNIQSLSNVCYKPVSFGRRIEEHRSRGARINPDTKEVSFKLFTYPDAQKVTTLVYSDGQDEVSQRIELENKGKGIFEKTGISPNVVKNGDKYQYEIILKDGRKEIIKDPYSFKQEEVNGPSTVYDQFKHKWKNDEKWKNDPNRITRTSNGQDGHRAVREAKTYALSPDTITDKRSYDAIIAKLKEIKENGFNAIEIMHIENTFSFNWGYDGVDKHAPSNYLGGPEKLKELVDEAHGIGLNVIFDVVPNHVGPDGNQLGRSGPYIKGPNDFGDAFNYEGKNSEYVRDFSVDALLNWIENYHIDGLRLDMTKYMDSDYTLKQIAAEINYHYPDVFIIAEDGRSGVSVDGNGNYWANNEEVHDKRVTSPLKPEEYGKGKSQDEHAKAIEKIIRGETNLSRLGMDSEWDFNFYHELDESLYVPNTDGLVKAILCAQDSVKYVASHDEIGNFEGTRKIAKLMVPKLRLNDNITLTMKDIERAKQYSKLKNKSFEDSLQTITFQKAQFTAEKLAIKYQTGELDKYAQTPEMGVSEAQKMRSKLKDEVLTPLGISPSAKISYKRIQNAFNSSMDQNKMAMAFVYSIPGPKMVFQGDENADLTPFRFFRKFESVPYEEYLYTEKGYAPGEPALEESTLGKIPYSAQGKERMNQFNALIKDLNRLNDENSALRLGYIDTNTIVDHPKSCVVGYNSIHGDNEIFAVTNLAETNYREDKDNEYGITFPSGRWEEILNTDDTKYGGTGRHMNQNEIIHGDGHTNKPINLAGNSTIYFKRVG